MPVIEKGLFFRPLCSGRLPDAMLNILNKALWRNYHNPAIMQK
ncbi:hypothetical protein Cabys_3739 [Caldithrix abyssi DSM 13497]|uniref:Uncharacterized protein n=1 Tax=Caldithrix abyssi DSM 13497 TaxID=880073 RepID=A0A1J1CCP3_CALAY|nr:hypothetical protein Cabys_3739 [Caldithrix abyssi DSM 13497]